MSDDMLEKLVHDVKRARKGGLKGGPARAKKLSAERRREIAQKAARTRWGWLQSESQ